MNILKKLKLIILLFPFFGKGQNKIKIELIDATTKLGIVDVTVYNKNSKKIYFSDEKGLVYLDAVKKSDTIEISHMSYETLIKTNLNEFTKAYALNPNFISLPELKISPISENTIINKAIEFLPLNFHLKPEPYVMSIESLTNTENRILKRFSGEIGSSFCIFSKPYKQNFFGISTSHFINNSKSANFNVGYTFSNSNIENIIDLSFINSIDMIENNKRYLFSFINNNTDASLWVLNYKPIKINKNNNLMGLIFIDKTSFAIVKIIIRNSPEFEVTSKWNVIGSGKEEKLKQEGVHRLKNTKTEIAFDKKQEKYGLKWIKNESSYDFIQKNKTIAYETTTEVIILPKILNLSDFNLISMYDFRPKDSTPKSINRSYVSKKIEQKLENLKAKYPDIELE